MALLVALALGRSAAGAPPVRIGPETQLQAIEFEFPNGQSFSEKVLQEQLQHPRLGKHAGWRRKFGFLPFVDPVEPAPLEPVEVQRDVARLREFYGQAGFPGTDVRYRVSTSGPDLVVVRFIVSESVPQRLGRLVVVGPDSTALDLWLPAELRAPWRRFASDLAGADRQHFGAEEARDIEKAVLGWFRERGYAFVSLHTQTTLDRAAKTLELRLRVTPGPRARIASVAVAGTERVDPQVVRDALPFAAGDWYSARKIADGQRSLINTNLFRAALVEVPAQAPDSVVQVKVRVEEGKPRLVTGEAGYLSDAGLTFKGEWAHRNYLGGARNLSVSAVAQTGVWSWEDDPERLVRGTVSLTQPGFIGRYVALVTSPYLEYRDDFRDRSARTGIDATLVYLREGWLRTASLKYGISTRRVYEYRSGEGGNQNIFDLIEAALDSLSERDNLSAFTLAATIGKQDHPVAPRRSLLFRPSLEVTTPGSFTTTQYTRLDLSVSLQRPLRGPVSLWGRAAIGRLYPFGRSVPKQGGTDGLERFIELRDHTFTAGGTSDVRGWGSRMLGPKIPDIIVDDAADTTHSRADRYVPVSGFARLTASGELRLPFPGLSDDWGTHVFLDGGRVWEAGEQYVGTDEYDQERFFFSTGFGIDRNTPVGPLRLSVGCMLNPSQLDVLKAQEFLDDVANGTLGKRPTPWTRRLKVHFAIGTGF